ncbi:hypothetical protein K435DRAFT_778610 [Dendrothele bispora CBS 962.96]|uniref:Uncharacterized protein n=1 Tax=Dendrothele bispora (strain CBS 962.96) TaxID=1314807 RepID=A0A4S8M3G4_DENBC|nr:hypothetical protein K435DRAFT_778610 [Dendrothele bispora CBS 962.96]
MSESNVFPISMRSTLGHLLGHHSNSLNTRPPQEHWISTEKQALQPESIALQFSRDINVSAVSEDTEKHLKIYPATDDDDSNKLEDNQATLESIQSLPMQVDTPPGDRSTLIVPQLEVEASWLVFPSSSDNCSTSPPTGVKRTKEEKKAALRAGTHAKSKEKRQLARMAAKADKLPSNSDSPPPEEIVDGKQTRRVRYVSTRPMAQVGRVYLAPI